MKKLKYKKNKAVRFRKLNNLKLNNKSINLIDVKYDPKKPFEKISKKSNNFINNSFDLAFSLIKKKKLKNLLMDQFQKKIFLVTSIWV